MWYPIAGINDAGGHLQHWHAFQERRVSLGDLSPFPQCHEYDSFHIDAIVDNGDGTCTITDGSKDWTFGGGARKMWTEGIVGTDWPGWARPPFDVVLDADRTAQPGLSQPDWRTVFQAHVYSQPSATQIRFTFNIAKYCAELNITLGSLVGRTGWFLRSSGDNWTRGPIPWPNAPHWTMGVVTASAAGTLTSDREVRHPKAIIGQQVVYLAGGTMQRGTVATADPTTRVVTFTATTAPPVVGQEFYVIAPGAYFQFGRAAGTAQRAYAGLKGLYIAHDYPATNGTTTVGKPRLTEPVMYGEDPGSCPPFATDETLYVDDDGLDVDYYIGYANQCSAGDEFLAPNWWNCYRALWCGLYRLAVNFEPYGAADGLPHAVPTFSYATFLYAAGINPHAGTCGTHSGTTMPCALGVPHTPINLWWSIVDADGVVLISGYERAYNGSTINGTFSAVHDGKTVKASTGPTRVVERAFDAFYDVTYFLPDILAGSPVLPPTDANPGRYVTIPKADHYLRADLATGQISRSTLSRDQFGEKHVARFVGHRKMDPGFPLILPSSATELAPYHNNAYVGLRTPEVQARIDASRAGAATGGSARRVVDADRDWDAVDFMPATNGKTHAFIASGGGTTSCVVPGAAGTGFWDATRYPGGQPFAGFCFEVITNGNQLGDPTNFNDPAAVIEKRLIATGTTGGTLTWAEPTSVTVGGKACRIVEPFVLNPLKDRPVTLRSPGGAKTTLTIEGSHGDTLFIPNPAGFVVGPATRYRIDEAKVNDTFIRVAGKWVTTSNFGADERYPGVNFQAEASSNQPDKVHEYGLPHAMDVTFDGPNPTGCLEWQQALAVLKEFPVSWGWEDPANNNRDASWHNETTNYGDWASHVISGDGSGNPAYYNHNTNTVSGAPFAHWLANGTFTPWDGSTWQTGPGWSGRVNRQFNRAIAFPPHTPFAKTILFYNYAERFGSNSSTPAPSPTVATGAFDANGDPVAENAFRFWSSKSATTADVTSDPLGSLAVPNDAGAPAKAELPSGAFFGDSGSVSHRAGYTVTNVWVACRPAYVFG
jgi:hypothetical protein